MTMQLETLKKLVVGALEDLKGLDITVLDVRTLTTITDYMIISTGTSDRHVKSLAENVVTTAKKNHLKYIRTEGQREGDWIIVDLADIIVHVMQKDARSFYKLEDLWEPIKLIRENKK